MRGALGISVFVFCLYTNTAVFAGIEANDKETLYRKADQLLDDYEGNTALLVEAQGYLRQILEADPNYALAYVGMARVISKDAYISYQNYEQDKLREAQKYLVRAIELEPKLFEAYEAVSYTYFRQKDMPNAKKALAEAEKLRPGSAEVLLLAAELALYEKNYDQAIDRSKEALTATSEKGLILAAYGNLDEAHQAKKEYGLAEEAYKEQLKLSPNSPWIKVNYSSFLTRRNRYDEAIVMAKSALEDMEFSMGRHVLAEAYYKRGVEYCWMKKDYAPAEADFKAALENESGNANAYYGLGVCYRFLADRAKDKQLLKKSEDSFKKALELNPNHEAAKTELKKHYEWIKK